MSLFVGLISGTSVDAIDAALVEFLPSGLHVIAYRQESIPEDLREQSLGFNCAESTVSLARLLELDAALGNCFAEAVLSLLKSNGLAKERIRAIGCHGQTILHYPEGRLPSTLQIGDPNRIALQTGITTVADFRRMDMAAGGQGAPLAPAFHAAYFRQPDINRAVVNIGGIANISFLPADEACPVLGFDCGPGNALMDEWAQRHLRQRFDPNGSWAAQGKIIEPLLDAFIEDSFILRKLPKSTGRDYFNGAWLDEVLAKSGDIRDPVDVQTTLLEFTVRGISEGCKQLPSALDQVLVCGGGVHNLQLVSRLKIALPNCSVISTADLGILPDAVEATCFAWLAKQRMEGLPGNLPSVTGASRSVLLGSVYAGN